MHHVRNRLLVFVVDLFDVFHVHDHFGNGAAEAVIDCALSAKILDCVPALRLHFLIEFRVILFLMHLQIINYNLLNY